jgi:hypothetical protein
MKHRRFFGGFDTNTEASGLLNAIIEGGLSQGSKIERAKAIAWCVRFLSITNTNLSIYDFLKVAEELHKCEEIEVAYFFLESKVSKDYEQSISKFIRSESTLKRDAALIVYSNLYGASQCLHWVSESRFTFEYFGLDGLINLFGSALEQKEWELTKKLTQFIETSEINESPALYNHIAITYLSHAVLDSNLKGKVIPRCTA